MPVFHLCFLRILLGTTVCCLLLTQRAIGQPLYTITDLGTLSGRAGDYSTGRGINNLGHIVGQAFDNTYRPFYWPGSGNLVPLTLSGWSEDDAYAINDSDHVVGRVAVADANGQLHTQAFSWMQAKRLTFLPSLNGQATAAFALNNSNQIAGHVYVDSLHPHAALWNNGKLNDLGVLPGDTGSGARGINSQGHVVGSGSSAPFVWTPENGMQALPGGSGYAFAINDQDSIVGVVSDTACRWANKQYTQLRLPSPDVRGVAYSINNSSQIVGASYDVNHLNSRAILWDNDTPIDLNMRLEHGTGWSLSVATSINNAGQITGYGSHNGYGHAFLLTPLDRIDSDGDGIPDEWERDKGYWYTSPSGPIWVNLPCADPACRDIYVQIDWLEADDHTHNPFADALGRNRDANRQRMSDVVAAFKKQGINLHLICGQAIRETKDNVVLGAVVDSLGINNTKVRNYSFAQFDGVVSELNYLREAKGLAYHTCLFAHSFPDEMAGTIGISRAIPNQDFIVALGSQDYCGQPVGSPFLRAVTFMHELGHNLGLRHGGCDDEPFKPNYLSVMSCLYNSTGLARPEGQHILDYSHSILPILDEDHLDETVGLGIGRASKGLGIYWALNGATVGQWIGDGSVDWNQDGAISQDVAVDISSGDPSLQDDYGQRTKLYGNDDWSHLSFQGGNIAARSYVTNPIMASLELPPLPVTLLRPFPPQGLALRISGQSARLGWTSAGLATEFSYHIYRSVGNGAFVQIRTGIDPLITDTALDHGTRYTYRVTVVDENGNESDPSSPVSGVVQ